MQEKISYLHTKCHLMRLSLDYRTRAILDKVSSPSPETEFDSLTKFLKENASQRPLGEKQSVT